jgi:Mor family transcriptional regulator
MTSRTELATTLLPPLLQDFVRLIGIQAVMALVEHVGGLRIYIPTPEYATADHQFAEIIGVDNLVKLGKAYGGQEHFQLPKAYSALVALRNARIAADYAATKTARQLAAEHRLTESQIVRIVARQGVTAPADRRQLKLL